ncbi:hypothetical protein [Agrobacterium sp. CG674]
MQVYCNGRMVGEIALRPSEAAARDLVIAVPPDEGERHFLPGGFDGDGLIPDTAAFNTIRLKRDTVSVSLDPFRMDTDADYLRMMVKTYKVPESVRKVEELSSGGARLIWDVLNLDADTFEAVFDLDQFTACDDNGPDPEIYERRRAGLWDGV